MSAGAGSPCAAALPLLVESGADGRPVALEGHLPRRSPLVAALQADARALVLWMGPNGYVSPSWLTDRTQAPTWNCASLQAHVRVAFDDDAGALRRHLDALVAAFEAGRPAAWRVDETGARYAALAARIVAFRAEVVALDERFKLGQDERDDVYLDIVAGLDRSGGAALAGWMRRCNPGRPQIDTG